MARLLKVLPCSIEVVGGALIPELQLVKYDRGSEQRAGFPCGTLPVLAPSQAGQHAGTGRRRRPYAKLTAEVVGLDTPPCLRSPGSHRQSLRSRSQSPSAFFPHDASPL